MLFVTTTLQLCFALVPCARSWIAPAGLVWCQNICMGTLLKRIKLFALSCRLTESEKQRSEKCSIPGESAEIAARSCLLQLLWSLSARVRATEIALSGRLFVLCASLYRPAGAPVVSAAALGLYPTDDLAAAKCDAIMDSSTDFSTSLRPSFMEKDEAKKVRLGLKAIRPRRGTDGFLAGACGECWGPYSTFLSGRFLCRSLVLCVWWGSIVTTSSRGWNGAFFLCPLVFSTPTIVQRFPSASTDRFAFIAHVQMEMRADLAANYIPS